MSCADCNGTESYNKLCRTCALARALTIGCVVKLQHGLFVDTDGVLILNPKTGGMNHATKFPAR